MVRLSPACHSGCVTLVIARLRGTAQLATMAARSCVNSEKLADLPQCLGAAATFCVNIPDASPQYLGAAARCCVNS